MKYKTRMLTASLLFVFVLMQLPALAANNVIPYPKGYDTITAGASSYEGKSNSKESPYFKHPDFYNMKSSAKGLTIISGYKTYQQTTDTSCGPAAALTVLYHYGVKSFDELKIAELMGTVNRMRSGSTELGTSTLKMMNFFNALEWNVESSITSADKSGVSFNTIGDFSKFVRLKLKGGVPIMVENMYLGGHWRVIIGYDTMNTPQLQDDVLIYADSYDTNDHNQDGYSVESLQMFYYTWMDLGILPADQQVQQWITASPKAKTK